MDGLEGARALVTGGSSDIGRAICVALKKQGCQVELTYFSDHERAAEAGVDRVHQVNFADVKNTEAFLGQLEGKFDIVIAAAASGLVRPLGEQKARHWQWSFSVGAQSLLSVAAHLSKSDQFGAGARIVALSSLGATRAIPQYAGLGASKAALESICRHLAVELGPQGIRVNVVSPGLVETRALDHFPNREQLLDAARRRTPLGRFATPTDVAQVVLFLCSDAASMIHGQTLHVDGGYSVVA